MKYYSGLLSLIGSTPLVRLKNIEEHFSLNSRLFAKLERCNPTGSIKDRAAKSMICGALERGEIKKTTTIVEPTSGNTGISIAAISSSLGLKSVIFMPENMSKERIAMMKFLGSELVLTPASEGMKGATDRACEYLSSHPDSYMLNQFSNLDNTKAHYLTTGPEIYSDLDGLVSTFVAAFGTGGTLTGVGKYLKERSEKIEVIGVEPYESPLVTKGYAGKHGIQGIGANFKPNVLDLKYVDDVISVSTAQADEFTHLAAEKEGLFVGISSGANLCAAVRLAKERNDANIVTIFPDNGERYLSIARLFGN